MFDCATCTVPMLGESTVYTPSLMLWISPSMRLPSLSSIVGAASTPEARPSRAAARQASRNTFIGATLGALSQDILLHAKKTKWEVPPAASMCRAEHRPVHGSRETNEGQREV